MADVLAVDELKPEDQGTEVIEPLAVGNPFSNPALLQQLLAAPTSANLPVLASSKDLLSFTTEDGQRAYVGAETPQEANLFNRLQRYSEPVRSKLLELELVLPQVRNVFDTMSTMYPTEYDEQLLTLIDKA
jgi:hypothetical protein